MYIKSDQRDGEYRVYLILISEECYLIISLEAWLAHFSVIGSFILVRYILFITHIL